MDLSSFMLVILPIALSPGTSFILALSNLSLGSFKSIFPVIAGTCAGIAVHSALGGFGISAILSRHQTSMTILHYVGIAFLIFLGIKLIHTGIRGAHVNSNIKEQIVGIKQSFLLNLINVRAIMLYVTVVPVFAGAKLINYIVLSAIHSTILAIWILLCAIVIQSTRHRFALNKLRFIINTVGGITLLIFAIVLLLDYNRQVF